LILALKVRGKHEGREISSQEAVHTLEESLASAIYEAAVGTIDSKVVAMSAGRTPMYKKGTPRWWTRELREREATIRNTKREYYAYRSDIHAEYVIATKWNALEDELAIAIDKTERNMQRERSGKVERLFGEEEQAGHRKHAWDTIQDTRKRSRDGAGRSVPLARGSGGAAARDARESAQNWRDSCLDGGRHISTGGPGIRQRA